MKTNNYINKGKALLLCTICILLSACTKDMLEQDNLKDTPIAIASANVTGLATRTITNNKLSGTTGEPAEMSVWILSDTEKYNAHNMKWSHNGETWNSNSTALYEGKNKQQICAIYPYSANANIDNGITVNAEEQTDYLVASLSQIGENPVNLTMTHALAKLVLQPTFGSEIADNEIKSVEVQNMYSSGTLNIKDNTWSNLSTADKTLSMTNKEVLVIPMPNCTTFPIVITMSDGRIFKANVSLANHNNAIEAGTQYTLKVKIGQDKVENTDTKASAWGIYRNN